MKRNRTLLLATLMLLTLALSSCAPAPTTAPAPAPDNADTLGESHATAIAPDARLNTTVTTESGLGRDDLESRSVYNSANTKLIRKAQLILQTTEFDVATAALEKLTNQCGGYYETADTQGGDYYESSTHRYGNYTIRIPHEQCTAFLHAVGEVGHVVTRNESSEDVGEAYYDVSLRLATQKTKQERLLSLMGKAEQMEDIIQLENALAEVQYQVEQYTSQLKKYDALVSFSTIGVTLEEVSKITDTPGEAAPLNARVANAFTSGVSSFGEALGNLTVWLAYHFFAVFLFAALAVVGVFIGRRYLKKQWTRAEPTPPKEQK